MTSSNGIMFARYRALRPGIFSQSDRASFSTIYNDICVPFFSTHEKLFDFPKQDKIVITSIF